MRKIDNNGIQELVGQLKSMAAQAHPTKTVEGGEGYGSLESSKVDFADVFKSVLEQVDATQKNASDLGQRFAFGDKSVQLSDVMIEEQKANIAMQATLKVRDRLISAYTNIMNMSI